MPCPMRKRRSPTRCSAAPVAGARHRTNSHGQRSRSATRCLRQQRRSLVTSIISTKSKRRLPARLAAGLAVSALLVLGPFAGSASAAQHGSGQPSGHTSGHGGGHPSGHAGGYGGGHGSGYGGWQGGGGYYAPPPVVYGSPYGGAYYGAPYYPPPVVYAPGITIGVPGIGVTIY